MEKTLHLTVIFLTITAFAFAFSGCDKEPENTGKAPVSYDYDFNASLQSGDYYGVQYAGGHNFYTWLSDTPFDANGYTQAGGTYYLFDIFSPAPEDMNDPKLPAGTYTLGKEGAIDEYTFTPDYSLGITINGDGTAMVMDAVFTEGTLDVGIDGDDYIFEASLTDQNGKTHHVTYKGPARWTSDPLPYNPITNDLEISAIEASADYVSEENGTMCVSLRFTDMETVYDGYVTPPGSTMHIEAYMPFNETGDLEAGTYEIAVIPGDRMTLASGEILDIQGKPIPLGTYVIYYDPIGAEYYGTVSSGTMKINGDSGNYDIECAFATMEGHNITCIYSGQLAVSGIPSGDGFSTLKGDYTLDLRNAVCSSAAYFGDDYGTGGGDWYFMIAPLEGIQGDGLQVDLVGNSLDFDAGIPTGTYTAAPPETLPGPDEYFPGYYDDGSLGGTVFLGGFDSMGYATEYAPATKGDLNITNHGDGTYTLSFCFMDDKGNRWDGEWTGTIEFDNYSSFSKKTKPRATTDNFRFL